MTLPVNVGKGYVTGTFMDSSGTLAEGTVTFTPSPAKVLDATATPPTTILPQPVVVTLAEGTFLQQLVATDDADLNPSGWTYTVSFRVKFGPLAVDVAPFSISLPTGGSDSPVDLTLVSPVASIDGTFYTRGMGVPDPTGGGDGETLVLVDGVPVWAPSDSLSLDSRYLTQSGTDAAVAAKISDTTPSASRSAVQSAVSAFTVWQPTTAYVSGQTIQAPDGSLIKANSSRTSRASFDATEQATWTPVATQGGTLEQAALAAAFLGVNRAPVEVNALAYGIKTSNSAAANDTALAALAAAYTGNVLIAFPEVGTYNFSAPLPDRSNLRLKGMGASTVLNWTTGSMLAPSSGSALAGLHFSDLTLSNSGSASHLVELGSGLGITYSTFERVIIGPLLDATSIFHGNNFTNFFGIRFRDCQLSRSATASVSAFDLKSAGSGMNTLTWTDCLIHSHGNTTGGPFGRLESLAASSYLTGISMRNIVGEQNAAGILHCYGADGLVIDNVLDHDQSTYADDLFKVDTGSGGVQSYNCRFETYGTTGSATFTSGAHLHLASGSGHVIGKGVNGASPEVAVNDSSVSARLRNHVAALVQGIATTGASLTLGRTHHTVINTGSSTTITLPDATTMPAGRDFWIKNLHSTASMTLALAVGTQKIDKGTAGASLTIPALTAVRVITDGANWITF